MNINKAQKEIFNAMLSGSHIKKFEMDNGDVFITPDGVHGFAFPQSTLQINIDRIPSCKNLDIEKIVKEENLCRLTKECLVNEFPKELLRKLKRGDQNIYFNSKYMECFQNPKFYSEGGFGMIVVTEDISAMRLNTIVGIIMPKRVKEEFYE